MKKQTQKIKFFQPEEVEKMVSMVKSKKEHAIIAILFSTGLRVSELAGLPLDPFLKATKNSTMELPIIGKGLKQRVVFFSPSVLKIISDYVSGQQKSGILLFPFTVRTIQRIVARVAERVGLKAWPHKCRHSFATNLLRQGVNLFDLKEFMGHNSILTTQIYLHTTNPQLKELHEKLFV